MPLSLASHPPVVGLSSQSPVDQAASTTPTATSSPLHLSGPATDDLMGLVVHEPPIPTLRLQLDTISDTIAAKIATSFLSHVLFLKSQVPMPISHMHRLPAHSSNMRAVKQREEFMESLDILSSHLDTTFTALSTAFASSTQPKEACRSAHIGFFLGPSVSSAKSKVFFAVDGLEEKRWGVRDDLYSESDGEDVPTSDDEEQGDEDDDEDDDKDDDNDEDDNANGHEGEGHEAETQRRAFVRSPTPSPCPPSPNYLRSQSAHLEAERLLSRALANNDSLAAEIGPTQIHILLQAPRRFVHPAWIPRMNISAMLDRDLKEFTALSVSPPSEITEEAAKAKGGRRVGVEGIRLSTRFGFPPSDIGSRKVDDEEDELIWWCWEGKLAGFN